MRLSRCVKSGPQGAVYLVGNRQIRKEVPRGSVELRFYHQLLHWPVSKQALFCPLIRIHDTVLLFHRCTPIEMATFLTDPKAIQQCVHQIRQALDYLRGQHILHNDATIGNVMKHGKRYVLIDFGLATMDSRRQLIDRIYLAFQEDQFHFLQSILWARYEPFRILDNDFRGWRNEWIRFFQKRPEAWRVFCALLSRCFPLQETGFQSFFQTRFLPHILVRHHSFTMTDDLMHSIYTKLCLQRFHFLFCLLYRTDSSFRDALLPWATMRQKNE